MGRMRVSLLHRKRSQLLTPNIFSSFPGRISELHCNENPIYVFPEKEYCADLVPISTFMCLSAIYIFLRSVHIFSFCRIGRPMGGIYSIDCSEKLGLRPCNFFSGNICFDFLYCVFAVCMASFHITLLYELRCSMRGRRRLLARSVLV
jgi:hypothetical protein